MLNSYAGRLSSPLLIEGYRVRDLEVRAVVRLGHYNNLKGALAHAFELETVRRDDRAHRIKIPQKEGTSVEADRSRGVPLVESQCQ